MANTTWVCSCWSISEPPPSSQSNAYGSPSPTAVTAAEVAKQCSVSTPCKIRLLERGVSLKLVLDGMYVSRN